MIKQSRTYDGDVTLHPDTKADADLFGDLQEADPLFGKNPKPQKQTKPAAEGPRYPCPRCSGTGTWHGGYVNPVSGPCHACNGRGYFKTSPHSREQGKQKRAQIRVQSQEETLKLVEDFKVTYPAEYDFLIERSTAGNEFSIDLIKFLYGTGGLTEGQLGAVHNMMAKHADWKKERAKPTAQIDLSQVREKFEKAFVSGIKRPVLRVTGFVLNRAPDKGKNPGAIYVKDETGLYLGKVDTAGAFYKSRECTPDQVTSLVGVSSNVLEAAVAYGRRTGNCSCCGRTLTKGESIDLGIGPICRSKWGL